MPPADSSRRNGNASAQLESIERGYNQCDQIINIFQLVEVYFMFGKILNLLWQICSGWFGASFSIRLMAK